MARKISLLIIGGGSIGQRHLRNLKSIGIKKIGVVDADNRKLDEIKNKYQVETFKNVDAALKKGWGAFLISTPSFLHAEIALKLIKEKIPIFIEKPLSNSFKNIDKLAREVKKAGTLIVMGYNLNFHPQIKSIRKILNDGLLGRVLGIRAEFGYYLPSWRPNIDYRKNYSAQKKLGGGIILEDIHEIDYLFGLFGEIKKIFSFSDKISDLEIDTEDYVEATLWFKNGIIGQLHMDFLQRSYSRTLKIIGEKGNLYWDLEKGELKYYSGDKGRWYNFSLKDYDFNVMYIDEMRYFLRKIKNPDNNILNFERGYKTLKIALAIKESAKLGRAVRVK